MGINNILKPKNTATRNITQSPIEYEVGEIIAVGTPMENPEPQFISLLTNGYQSKVISTDYPKLADLYPKDYSWSSLLSTGRYFCSITGINNPDVYLAIFQHPSDGQMKYVKYTTLKDPTVDTLVIVGDADFINGPYHSMPSYCNGRYYFLTNDISNLYTTNDLDNIMTTSVPITGVDSKIFRTFLAITYHPELKKYFMIDNVDGYIGTSNTYNILHTSDDGVAFTSGIFNYSGEGTIGLGGITYSNGTLYVAAKLTIGSSYYLAIFSSADGTSWEELDRTSITSNDPIPYSIDCNGKYIFSNLATTALTLKDSMHGFIYEIGVGFKITRKHGDTESSTFKINSITADQSGNWTIFSEYGVEIYDKDFNLVLYDDWYDDEIGFYDRGQDITNSVTYYNSNLWINSVRVEYQKFLTLPQPSYFYEVWPNIGTFIPAAGFERSYYVYTGEEE